MRCDITNYIRTCNPCQKIKHNCSVGMGYLQPLVIPGKPFDTVSLNFITGLPLLNGKDAILVLHNMEVMVYQYDRFFGYGYWILWGFVIFELVAMATNWEIQSTPKIYKKFIILIYHYLYAVLVDKLTKLTHFIATTSNINAGDTAILIFKHMVKVFRLPEVIVGDRDPRWISSIWKNLVVILNSRLVLSTSKHPQTDRQTKVMNQQLETMLHMYVHTDQKDWSHWLDVLQMAYNNTPHSSHKEAPAKLLLGFKPCSPSDLLQESRLEFTDGLLELRQRLTELASHHEAAHDALKCSLDKQAYYYDQGRCLPNLKEGNEVLINPHSLKLVDVKGKSHKLVQRKIGPFEIIEVLSPTTYRLQGG